MNVLKHPDEWFKAMFEEGCAQVAGKPCSLIVWHPYPQEEPMVEGEYLATDRFGRVTIESFVDNGSGCVPLAFGVIAWAELPKPYKGT